MPSAAHRFSITSYLLLFALALSVGCSDSRALPPLAADAVVLAFGDSLTQGKGAESDQSYPSQLAALIARKVINAGISGETSDRGLARLPKALQAHKPSLVILMHGGNDVLRNKDLTQTKANLDAMIRLCQDAGAAVVLVGIPQKSLFSTSAPLYEELAKKHNLVFEPDIVSTLLKQPAMKADMVHFNAQGYAILAAHFQNTLAKQGAI